MAPFCAPSASARAAVDERSVTTFPVMLAPPKTLQVLQRTSS